MKTINDIKEQLKHDLLFTSNVYYNLAFQLNRKKNTLTLALDNRDISIFYGNYFENFFKRKDIVIEFKISGIITQEYCFVIQLDEQTFKQVTDLIWSNQEKFHGADNVAYVSTFKYGNKTENYEDMFDFVQYLFDESNDYIDTKILCA